VPAIGYAVEADDCRSGCLARGASTVTARKRREPDSESVIYVDRDAAGTIIVRAGEVTAIDADGAPLGTSSAIARLAPDRGRLLPRLFHRLRVWRRVRQPRAAPSGRRCEVDWMSG
jgi:hypothetical protein